jgi:hypothetical protein
MVATSEEPSAKVSKSSPGESMFSVLADARQGDKVYVYDKNVPAGTTPSSVVILPGTGVLPLNDMARCPTDGLTYMLTDPYTDQDTYLDKLAALYKVNPEGTQPADKVMDLFGVCTYCYGIVVDNSSTAYITSYEKGRIYKWSGSGEAPWVALNTRSNSAAPNANVADVRFHYPWGIAFNAAGDMLVSESSYTMVSGHQVWLVKQGTLQLVARTGSQGSAVNAGDATTELDEPTGVAFGHEDASVYIADNGNRRLLKVTLDCAK